MDDGSNMCVTVGKFECPVFVSITFYFSQKYLLLTSISSITSAPELFHTFLLMVIFIYTQKNISFLTLYIFNILSNIFTVFS